MDTVIEQVRLCEKFGARAVIAVIPGERWPGDKFETIRSMLNSGHELAQHGYLHSVSGGKRTLWSHVHGAFFSGNTAEHLAFDRKNLLMRLRQGRDFLSAMGPVHWYVPPAWAMGPLEPADLRCLEIDVVETFWGFQSINSNKKLIAPVLGFQATDRVRQLFLLLWNKLNVGLQSEYCRIAYHPEDFTSHMERRAKEILEKKLFIEPRDIRGILK